jgi:hypothetical protein
MILPFGRQNHITQEYADPIFMTSLYLQLLSLYDFETLQNYKGYSKLRNKFYSDARDIIGEPFLNGYISSRIDNQIHTIQIDLNKNAYHFYELYKTKYPETIKKLEEQVEDPIEYISEYIDNTWIEMLKNTVVVYSTAPFYDKYTDVFLEYLNRSILEEIRDVEEEEEEEEEN